MRQTALTMSSACLVGFNRDEREITWNNALIPELKAMVCFGGKRWHVSLIDKRFLASISLP